MLPLIRIRNEFRECFPLAWPMITSQVSHIIMGAVDNIMIAKVGVNELAAAAFCNNLFAVFVVTQLGLASAISPLIANAIGAKDFARVGKLFRHGLLVLVMASFVMSALMLATGSQLPLFGQTPEVNALFWQYFPWLIATLPLIACVQAQRQLYDGIQQSKVPMRYNYYAIPLNVFFNWVFIFGNLGAPEMGLAGAGLATLLARVGVVFLFSRRTYFDRVVIQKYQLSFRNFQFDKEIWRKILHLGLPSSFQYFFEVGAFAAAGVLAGQIGNRHIAAHQIALNIVSLTFMVAAGWSFATSVRIGNALGEDDLPRCRSIGFLNVQIISLYMLAISVLFFLTRDHLGKIYVEDPKLIAMVAGILTIAGIFQIADGVQAVAIGMLRGLQESFKPTLITMIAYWLVAIPLAHYLAFSLAWGLEGIWIGLAVGLFLSAGGLVLLFDQLTKSIGVAGFAGKKH